MNRTRSASSFFAALLVALLAVLFLAPDSSAQTLAERAREAKKKKEASTRKVWTNEDILRLEGGFGFNVVGTSLQKPEEAQPAAGQAAAPAQTEEKNFYSDMSLEEREQWVATFEQEVAEAEAELVDLRSRALSAPTEEERATARQQMVGLEQKVAQTRAEIDIIRNTPPPKAKPAAMPK